MKGKQNVEEEKKNLQVDSSLDGSPIYLGLSDRMNEHDSGIENVEVIGKQDAELWSQTSSLGDDEAEKEKGDCLEKQIEVEDPKNKEKVKSIEKCSEDQFKSPGVQISEDVTVHYRFDKVNAVENVAIIDPMKWNSDSDWIIEKPSFKSRIIMNNAKYWKDMSRRQKDIADFCFHEHRLMNTSNVFKHDLHCWRFVVDFNGIRSLNEGVFIDTIVIDAWALILNKSVQYHNAQNSYLTRKFYFNTQHSSYLQGMLRATDPAVIDRMGYNARSCWHFSMKQIYASA
ncbi:uncharacterized protein LOC131006770 isoform X4 [Salvia miltiorrhiza]|uniref:uncharacterized protein LOC131006770 isoform X4 n=1 Tax=Salvia miltiorrhiza TaxID=226208 RepID=UPI0025AB7508|nr:uncharacterized protein LOC131006770 isoform X4 [Salvia miltiorrhiza]